MSKRNHLKFLTIAPLFLVGLSKKIGFDPDHLASILGVSVDYFEEPFKILDHVCVLMLGEKTAKAIETTFEKKEHDLQLTEATKEVMKMAYRRTLWDIELICIDLRGSNKEEIILFFKKLHEAGINSFDNESEELAEEFNSSKFHLNKISSEHAMQMQSSFIEELERLEIDRLFWDNFLSLFNSHLSSVIALSENPHLIYKTLLEIGLGTNARTLSIDGNLEKLDQRVAHNTTSVERLARIVKKAMRSKNKLKTINKKNSRQVLSNKKLEDLEKKLELLLSLKSIEAENPTVLLALANQIKVENYDEYRKTILRLATKQGEDLALLYYLMATSFVLDQKYDQAYEWFNKVIGLQPNNAKYLYKTSEVCYFLGYYKRGTELMERTLEIDKEVDKESKYVACDYTDLGLFYMELEQYDKAEENLNNAVEMGKKVLGKIHPKMSVFYNNLGLFWKRLKDYPKALSYYQRSLKIDKKLYHSEHPDIAIDYNNLGTLHQSLGEYAKAITYLKAALKIDKKAFGEKSDMVAIRCNNLGLVLHQNDDSKRAKEFCDCAVKIDLPIFGKNHPRIAIRYNNLGLIHDKLKNYSIAIEYLKQAYVISIRANSPNKASLKNYRQNLVRILSHKNSHLSL